jgi:surface antigen
MKQTKDDDVITMTVQDPDADIQQTPVVDEFYASEIANGIEVEVPPEESEDEGGIGGSSDYAPRLTAPKSGNKYYTKTSYGGVNECILGSPQAWKGSALRNCVGYSWGRAYELTGKRPTLSRGNAEDWYGYKADGYKRSQKPQLGAIICWRKGKAGTASDGAGHVGVIEQIDWKAGTIKVSNSGYGASKTFWLSTYKIGQYNHGEYIHQGFIIIGDWHNDVLTPDGTWGKNTTIYTQIFLGTKADGIVSKQPKGNKKYLPAVSTASWEFKLIGATGSAMIKALQKVIGAGIDGKFGKKSVAALKAYLKKKGYTVSSSKKLEAIDVKSWQKYLNKQF